MASSYEYPPPPPEANQSGGGEERGQEAVQVRRATPSPSARHAVRSRAGAQPPSSSGWPCTVACDAHDPAPRLRAAPVPRLGRHADTAALGDGDGDGPAALCADTYVPRPPYRTCWLRAPVAQGSLLPGSHARYVPPYAHTSLGRTVAPQAALPSLCAQVDRARAGRRARVERAPLDRRLARQPPSEAAAARAACRGVAPRRLAAWSKRPLWQRHGSAPAAPQGAPVGSDSHGTPVADGRP